MALMRSQGKGRMNRTTNLCVDSTHPDSTGSDYPARVSPNDSASVVA